MATYKPEKVPDSGFIKAILGNANSAFDENPFEETLDLEAKELYNERSRATLSERERELQEKAAFADLFRDGRVPSIDQAQAVLGPQSPNAYIQLENLKAGQSNREAAAEAAKRKAEQGKTFNLNGGRYREYPDGRIQTVMPPKPKSAKEDNSFDILFRQNPDGSVSEKRVRGKDIDIYLDQGWSTRAPKQESESDRLFSDTLKDLKEKEKSRSSAAGGGFFESIFGGGESAATAAPAPAPADYRIGTATLKGGEKVKVKVFNDGRPPEPL